jgi:hypothetical protein
VEEAAVADETWPAREYICSMLGLLQDREEQDLGFRSFETEPHELMVGERFLDEYHMILEFDGSSH